MIDAPFLGFRFKIIIRKMINNQFTHVMSLCCLKRLSPIDDSVSMMQASSFILCIVTDPRMVKVHWEVFCCVLGACVTWIMGCSQHLLSTATVWWSFWASRRINYSETILLDSLPRWCCLECSYFRQVKLGRFPPQILLFWWQKSLATDSTHTGAGLPKPCGLT